MTVDAAQILADVYSATAEVGRIVTITTYADSYSTTTGKTTRTATDHSVLASPLYSQTRGVTSDSQPRGSAQMLIPASGLTFTLQVGAKVTAGSKVYTVTVVGRLEIGSTLLAYELTLQEGAP